MTVTNADLALLTCLQTGLRTDEVYQLLTNERRRKLVRALAAQSRPDQRVTTVADLAGAIVDLERPAAQAGERRAHRHRVRTSLDQTHLPLLDDLDVVEYHDRVNKISTSLQVDVLMALLTTITQLCESDADCQREHTSDSDTDATPEATDG